MPISDILAYEIYIILLFHIPAILVLISFCTYLYLNAKKSLILYSFLTLSGMLLIWMVSKVLKTVSPNASIRWFFIVTQYFGVQFMGYCLFLFSYIYTKNRLPSKKFIAFLAIPPTFSFLAVLSNPLHMQFYSYYDFYKDHFGPLFLPIQSVQYLYLLAGILLLSKNYTKQPEFEGRQLWAKFFATVTLIPIFGNLYYILFKLGILEWIFPIPVFDFSPIAGTIALILFIIPALRFRFFDISPFSYRQIFNQMPTGIVFVTEKGQLYAPNRAFQTTLGVQLEQPTMQNLLHLAVSNQDYLLFETFYKTNDAVSFILETHNNHFYRVRQRSINKRDVLLSFSDITSIMLLRKSLNIKNIALLEINKELETLSGKAAELSTTRIKTAIAQNLHDILGHSLTIALCTADLAANDLHGETSTEKLEIIYNLLTRSLADLKNAVYGNPLNFQETSLIKSIQQLENPNIELQLVYQGTPYELDSEKTEAFFRICQEAVTNSIRHGKAKKIHIFLRFFPEKAELFIIDNGVGCRDIHKSFGLSGMESRIAELNGTISFGSDGNQGFHIYAKIEYH